MIDRTEMFCLVGLIEPNLESNHGRLMGSVFVHCISQAILRYYSRYRMTMLFDSLTSRPLLQQICPRDNMSAHQLLTNSTVLP